MKKAGALEKLTSKLRNGLMIVLGSAIIGSGCYTSFHFPKKENEEYKKEIYIENIYNPVVFLNYNWDSDGDGIMDSFDPLPNTFGPYLDINGNRIIDWPDIRIFSPLNRSYSHFDFNFGFDSNPYFDSYFYGSFNYPYYSPHNNFHQHNYSPEKPKTKYRTNHNSRLRNNGGKRNINPRTERQINPRNDRKEKIRLPRNNKNPRSFKNPPKNNSGRNEIPRKKNSPVKHKAPVKQKTKTRR